MQNMQNVQNISVHNATGINNGASKVVSNPIAPKGAPTPAFASFHSYPPCYYLNNLAHVYKAPVEFSIPKEVVASLETIANKPQQPAVPQEVVSAVQTIAENTKKPEVKTVELTDNYIKNLEKGLNSQEKTHRMIAGSNVVERLREDSTRKENPALNALVNKMLQDPAAEVRELSLMALSENVVTGDDLTNKILQNMSTKDIANNKEAQAAYNILLRTAQ